MSDSKLMTKVVRVDIERDPSGLFFATSHDLKGLLVAKATLPEVFTEIPASIAALYEACGERVIVESIDDPSESHSWVAMPEYVAEHALARLRSL